MSTRHNTVNWIAAGLIGVFFIAGIWIIYDGARAAKKKEANLQSYANSQMAVDSQVVAQSVPIEKIDKNGAGATGSFVPDPVEVTPATLEKNIQPSSNKESFDAKGDLGLLDTSKNKPAPAPPKTEPAPTAPVSSPNARIADPSTNPPAANLSPSKSTATRWHLIYGSYSTQGSANTALKQLQDLGYTTTLLQPPSGKEGPYRISIFNNTERGKVEAFQGAFKGSTGNDTWILKN